MLKIENLHVRVGETEIIKGLSLQVPAGEVHAILMEPVGVLNTGGAGGPLTAMYDDSLA